MAFRSQDPRQPTAPTAPLTREDVERTTRNLRLVLGGLIVAWLVLAVLMPDLRPIMLALAVLYLVGGVLYVRAMSGRAMAKVEAAERGIESADERPPSAF